MNTKICEKCDKEMRLIPAGVSKKNSKPYSAFWTCDSRNGGCGSTARAEGEDVQLPPTYNEAHHGAVNPDRIASIEKKLDEILELLRA